MSEYIVDGFFMTVCVLSLYVDWAVTESTSSLPIHRFTGCFDAHPMQCLTATVI